MRDSLKKQFVRIVEEESALESPEAESTTISAAKEEAERNESTEADRSFNNHSLPTLVCLHRMQLMKKHSKRILKKQSLRLKKAVKNQSLVDSTAADIASVQVLLISKNDDNIILNIVSIKIIASVQFKLVSKTSPPT